MFLTQLPNLTLAPTKPVRRTCKLKEGHTLHGGRKAMGTGTTACWFFRLVRLVGTFRDCSPPQIPVLIHSHLPIFTSQLKAHRAPVAFAPIEHHIGGTPVPFVFTVRSCGPRGTGRPKNRKGRRRTPTRPVRTAFKRARGGGALGS